MTAEERARRYPSAVPPPEIGHGSDLATFVMACRFVRGLALPAATVVDLLWDWAGHRPGWDRRWIETKVRAAGRYGAEPEGGRL